MKKKLKKYYKDIKKEMDCFFLTKINFIKELNNTIMLYLSDNPNTNIEDVKKHFGTPKEIAEGFRTNDNTKIRKKVKIQIVTIISLLIIIGLLIYFIIELFEGLGYTVVVVK